jgi:micrococcal nuclease
MAEYKYNARLVRCIDADTLLLELDLGFHISVSQRIRLSGIDTDEIDAKDPEERKRAYDAKRFVEKVLDGMKLEVRTHKTRTGSYKRSFNRYIGDVYVVNGNNHILLQEMIKDAGYSK